MESPDKMISDIRRIAESMPVVKIMEVCGTHTQTIARYGIRGLLPDNVILITGPGCPVCVTDQRDIDNIIAIALEGIKIATYGDMVKVPGSQMRLDEVKTIKDNVKVIYSVNELTDEYVFFAPGFETTTPMTAYALSKGTAVYSCHKMIPPVLEKMTTEEDILIDGLIDPGHVSSIIGSSPYRKIKVPQVISGFEFSDVLESIRMLLLQIKDGRSEVENQYKRAVDEKGNRKAQELVNEYFRTDDTLWRGFGNIELSGHEPKDKKLDAKHIFRDIISDVPEPQLPSGCICDRIIKGLDSPSSCPLFCSGKCNPKEPIGPCMVSVEGACNVSYRNEK